MIEVEPKCPMISVRRVAIPRFQRSETDTPFTQGFALGYYISRPWRSGLKFSHRLGSDRIINSTRVVGSRRYRFGFCNQRSFVKQVHLKMAPDNRRQQS